MIVKSALQRISRLNVLHSNVLAPKCLRPDVSRPNVGFPSIHSDMAGFLLKTSVCFITAT